VLVQVGPQIGALPDYLVSTQDGTHWASTPVEVPGGFVGFGPLAGGGVSLSCGAPGTCLFVEPSASTSASTLLRSDDGGATWIVASPPGPRGDSIDGATCVGSSICDLAYSASFGTPSAFVQTTDGGVTWSAPHGIPGTSRFGMSGFDCASASSCLALLYPPQRPSAETTADAGASWTAVGWPATGPGFRGFSSTDGLACSTTTCLVAQSTVGLPLLLGANSFRSVTTLLRLTS
jgi:hypothetical protein